MCAVVNAHQPSSGRALTTAHPTSRQFGPAAQAVLSQSAGMQTGLYWWHPLLPTAKPCCWTATIQAWPAPAAAPPGHTAFTIGAGTACCSSEEPEVQPGLPGGNLSASDLGAADGLGPVQAQLVVLGGAFAVNGNVNPAGAAALQCHRLGCPGSCGTCHSSCTALMLAAARHLIAG